MSYSGYLVLLIILLGEVIWLSSIMSQSDDLSGHNDCDKLSPKYSSDDTCHGTCHEDSTTRLGDQGNVHSAEHGPLAKENQDGIPPVESDTDNMTVGSVRATRKHLEVPETNTACAIRTVLPTRTFGSTAQSQAEVPFHRGALPYIHPPPGYTQPNKPATIREHHIEHHQTWSSISEQSESHNRIFFADDDPDESGSDEDGGDDVAIVDENIVMPKNFWRYRPTGKKVSFIFNYVSLYNSIISL